MKKLFSLYLILFLFEHFSYSQDLHKIDSLENEIKKFDAQKKEEGGNIITIRDSTKANILDNICEEYWMNNPEKGMDYSMQLLKLSEQIGFNKGIVNAYNSMGVIDFYKGNYPEALEKHKKAIAIANKADYKHGIAFSHICIGNVFRMQGNLSEALKYYFLALKINEEIGDKKYISFSYNNIGIIYDQQHNYPEALKNYQATLKINEEIGYSLGVAVAYGNIGVLFEEQGNYPEALKNFYSSLSISEKAGIKDYIAVAQVNIGFVNHQKGNYNESLKNYFAALKIYEEIGDKDGIAHCYNNIGNSYFKQNKNNEAALYLNKGLALAREIGNLEYIKEGYYSLAVLDSALGNHKQSMEHYKLFIIARDSLYGAENTKKSVELRMQYDFDKKESIAKAEQEKKDAIALKELEEQKLLRNGLIFGFILVLLLAGVSYNRYRLKQKSNLKLSQTLNELKDTQHQLVKSEKMAAFGVMASRVAHEIQNPLNFVNNFSELSEDLINEIIFSNNEGEKTESTKLLLENIQKINHHGKRADAIVKELQKHTRAGTAHEYFESDQS